ncbi:MAG: glycosyltransferase family 2 protein [Chloroflexi bacterium]|nr:glycosyltransferase family 2 protein [Chloroflexota bacterium]
MSEQRPTFSIVAPIYNEESILPEFYRRTRAVAQELGGTFELVLIDDGSHDRTLATAKEIAAQDPCVKIISFSRNFGHQIAITAGIDYAEGDAVIIIDSDLQDPPEVIPELVKHWRTGHDVVYATRSERRGETWFKLATAGLFYWLINRVTSLSIPSNTGDFRLIDRRVVLALRQTREHHRFMRGLAVWVGFRQIGVEYVRHERSAGVTKYPLRRMLKLSADAITSFSYVPLQLATTFGFWVSGLALLAIPVVAVLRLMGSNAFFGQATTLIAVLFLGGVQLIFLGVIGEYLGRIYDEVKRRPLYIVGETVGLTPQGGAQAAPGPSPDAESPELRGDGQHAVGEGREV